MNRKIPMKMLVAAVAGLWGWSACGAAPSEDVVPDASALAPDATDATDANAPSLGPESLAPVRVRATRSSDAGSRPPIGDIPVFLDDEEFPIGTNGIIGFDMSWNTFDGGGITFASGGAFDLGGTIGQPDTDYLVGGEFTLAGGFFGRVAAPPDCPGDANGDSIVDFADITTVLANWLDFGAAGDVNNDWIVNFLDITIILANWNTTCP